MATSWTSVTDAVPPVDVAQSRASGVVSLNVCVARSERPRSSELASSVVVSSVTSPDPLWPTMLQTSVVALAAENPAFAMITQLPSGTSIDTGSAPESSTDVMPLL